jgi:hypothetical protein
MTKMTKTVHIEAAIRAKGRMTEEQVAFALERLRRLTRNAAVTVAYFLRARDWSVMDDTERRALGADFALRVAREEFPGLSKVEGSNSNLYVRW